MAKGCDDRKGTEKMMSVRDFEIDRDMVDVVVVVVVVVKAVVVSEKRKKK